MKIAIATGTRADWGLLQPLATELSKRGALTPVIATHQHLDSLMGNTIREIEEDGFKPEATFPAEGSAAEIMAMAAAGATGVLASIKPDAIIILGDRCEMLGIASAALLSGIPIIHIAGGTISEGAFDDSVRHAISKMATLHFPETPLSARRLIQMGEDPERVISAGALGVENSLKVRRMTRQQLAESINWEPGDNFMVVTLHAATLERKPPLAIQENMLRALERTADVRFLITYPNSDIDPAPLIRSLHDFEARMDGRAKVIPSLGRVRYLSAVALSSGVVGNSSSGLVEVPSLGVPTLDIGLRQKGRECGPSVIHCASDENSIVSGMVKIMSPEIRSLAEKKINPYYQPHPAASIAEKIISYNFSSYPVKKFHSL